MTRSAGTLGLLVAVAAFQPTAAIPDSGRAFFPTPPAHVSKDDSGLLVEFYTGMKAGMLKIETDRKTLLTFNLAQPFFADGVRVVCLIAPRVSATPPPGTCDRWPNGIIVGKTHVIVDSFDRPNLSGVLVHVATRMNSR